MHMEQEYDKLGWEFKKFYIWRILLALLIMGGMGMYLNDYFVSPYSNHLIHSPHSSHAALAKVLTTASALLTTTAHNTQSTLNRNTSRTDHCLSNMSYSECETYLNQDQNGRVIAQHYSTSVGMRCIEGDCSGVGGLVNYYYTFTLQMKFLQYFIVSYGANTLIAPALENQTIGVGEFSTTQWVLLRNGDELVLGKLFQLQLRNVTVMASMSLEQLQLGYGIDPNDIVFAADFNFPLDPTLTPYTLDSVTLFASHPTPAQAVTFSDLKYKLVILLILGVDMVLIVYLIFALINSWKKETFRHISTLDSLYKYQLNTIFQGKNPKNTVIITQSAFSSFYEELTQLIDQDYDQLLAKQIEPEKQQNFRFLGLIGRVRSKFVDQRRPLEEERSREVSNLKHMMKTAVNQISDSSSKKLREMFGKARQLHLAKAFFHFGYLSLMLPCSEFDRELGHTTMPLPSPISSFLRHINRTVHSSDIKFAFKFAFAFHPTIEQQLIMKIHFNLLHRYFTTLRQLDFGLGFGKQLGMEREIRYLQQTIDNNKYIFMTYLK